MIWELYAKYEDGTVTNDTRSYDENKKQSDQQYELECELVEENLQKYGMCIEYSVALIYDEAEETI